MSDVKQILVVDDHFEMLEFLRSMLEASDDDCRVLGVPSAEEGFFELRRTPFDLLITDVRLPGMSGFELVRRVQGVRPDMPILMITAYASSRGKEEAESLGIYRYFQKPFSTDALLSAVRGALYGREKPLEKRAEPVPAPEPSAKVSSQTRVQSRLQSLRSDTGAAQVVLSDAHGTVLFADGPENRTGLHRLAPIMARSLQNSLRLAEELGSVEPQTIQYQSGAQVDLYSANIGRDYFVMLLFERQARRGRIGTIWIFAQRAVRDLGELLPQPAEEKIRDVNLTTSEARIQRRGPEEERESSAPVSALLPEAERSPEGEDEPGPAGEDLLPEELMAEGSELAMLLENGGGDADAVDLDAFWEAAMSEQKEERTGGGLSLEEARERGLIPPAFDDSKE